MAAVIRPPSSWSMRPATLRRRPMAGVRRAVIHHDAVDAPDDHDDCPSRVAAHDDYHREVNGWAAIGYHRVTCPHGVTYAGRGLSYVGAHSEPANVDGIGYCVMGAGNRPMTPRQLAGLAAAIAQDSRTLRRVLTITDHRKVEPGTTSCPGDGAERQLPRLRGLVRLGSAKPQRQRVPPFPGRSAFRLGRRHPAVTQLGRQLVRLRLGRFHDGNGYQPGPIFTEFDRRNVARFQRHRPELRDDADGYPGPATWRLLHTLPARKR